MQKIVVYEDEKYYFVWKPHGMPTTFGLRYSFLEQIEKETPAFFSALCEQFSQVDEYGLLNRLDNDTAGLLYFAKTPYIKNVYKQQQDNKELIKIYLCDMYGKVDVERTVAKGNPQYVHKQRVKVDAICGGGEKNIVSPRGDGMSVSFPLMHHRHQKSKMVVIRSVKDLRKGRDTMHNVTTVFVPLYYDIDTNTTTCCALIHQGMRHQIRVHAAGIGYPLVGDALYGDNNTIRDQNDYLHLRSIGLSASCNLLFDM